VPVAEKRKDAEREGRREVSERKGESSSSNVQREVSRGWRGEERKGTNVE